MATMYHGNNGGYKGLLGSNKGDYKGFPGSNVLGQTKGDNKGLPSSNVPGQKKVITRFYLAAMCQCKKK